MSSLGLARLERQVTVEAGQAVTVDFNFARDGYSFLGAVGFATGSSSLVPVRCSWRGGYLVGLTVRNATSSAITTTGHVDALMARLP